MSITTCGQLHQRPITSAFNYNRTTLMWRPRGAARYTIGSHGNIIIPQILPKMLEYGWLGGMTFTNIYIWNIYIPVEVSEPSMDQLKFVEKLKLCQFRNDSLYLLFFLQS